ncbi:DEAD/DEAH box helicase [Georgenia sp. SYP-B2076]|uniref:DEAD/DEAH box helicase n=1 Tax=Georgenia sp. SYP-B2076 TaxID=2495881 RepID=UPI000F8E9ED6|nr:DEAD/DEAH box helicase [Georgenia sp. SYP-B2076]
MTTRPALADLRTWPDLPGEDQIRAAVGDPVYARGLAYARAGRVSWLTSDPGRRVLFAAVDGTATVPYQTIVQVGDAAGTRLSTGRCTCPMAVDCKHVAAVLAAARDDLSSLRRTAPAWERMLADVVEDDQVDGGEVPIGLQLETVVEPGWRGAPDRVRIRLRPVVPGRKSAWVRSGVSWRDLAFRWALHNRVERHREALHALHQAHRPSASAYSDNPVFLDEFGTALWPLLRAVADAGVPLVPARGAAGPVVVADAPATVALELTRDDDGDLTVVPVADLPGLAPVHVGGGGASLVGRPAHGVVLDSGDPAVGLVLAPLARPLTPKAAGLVVAGELDVPAADVERFLAEYYPTVRRLLPVRSTDGSVDLPTVAAPVLGLTLTYADDHELTLAWEFRYDVGDMVRRVPLDAAGGPGRDRGAEQRLLRALTIPADLGAGPGRTGPAPTHRLQGVDAAIFTEEVLPGLREQGVAVDVVGTPAEYRRSDAAPVIRVSATDSADDDWFDLGVTVEIEGERIPFEKLFTALARRDNHLVLLSGTYFRIDRPELDELRRLIEEAGFLTDKHSEKLRVTAYQAALWSELAALGVVEEQSARWSGAVARLLADEGGADPAVVPAGLRATLRPYQAEGFAWLSHLWDAGLGGILADDMGLGKTVQTLAALLRAKESGSLTAPALVVAPTSVVAGWADEARRFAPDLRVVVVTQTQKKAGRALADDVAGADLVVTSYALFRIDEAAYRALAWGGLILDEAQFVKNHQAKTYQCARRLRAPFKLAITGTPLENSLMDLWALLSIVAPGMFPDPGTFAELYRKPIERGNAEKLATLRRRIRPFIRRRTKEQVATDLPPKQEQVLRVQLNPRHRKIYDTHLQRERRKILSLLDDVEKNRFTILRSLTLLRQLSLDPSLVDEEYAEVRSSKADVFLEQLEEVVAGGHRALVFSQFTRFLATVRGRLDAAGIEYCYLDGRTRDRASRVAGFKTGDAPVFLISLKAGGTGLNLTEADYCFVLDPWWNPAAEAQAVDRAHRIGQDKNVMVYRLVAENTIEEKVLAMQARKRDLFDKVIDEGGALAAPLSAGDIRELLAV